MATLYANSDIAATVRRGLAAAKDRPNPMEDARCTAEKYARLGREFRRSAWKHWQDDGDLPQASNKAWGLVGLVAETVKAISAHHGGIIHTHRAIWSVGSRTGPAGRGCRRPANPGPDQQLLYGSPQPARQLLCGQSLRGRCSRRFGAVRGAVGAGLRIILAPCRSMT